MNKIIESDLTFSEVLEALKNGQKVARKNWNGKNMWLALVDTSPDLVQRSQGIMCEYLPHIDMYTVDKKLVPWVASQTDLLCEDWQTIEFSLV